MHQERYFVPLSTHDIPLLMDKPNTDSQVPCILMLHGFMAYKEGDGHLLQKLSNKFTEHGIATARFDFVSMGENRYSRQNYTIDEMVKETKEIFSFVSQHPQIDSKKILILGHSLGCRIASYCTDLPSIGMVFLNGAIDFSNPDFLKTIVKYDFEKDPNIISTSDGRKELLYASFFEKPKEKPDILNYKNPILVCIGKQDPTIDPNIGREFYQSRKISNNYLIEIEEANHTFNAKTKDYTKVYELYDRIEKILSGIL